MYKLLICDDEEYIVDGMVEILSAMCGSTDGPIESQIGDEKKLPDAPPLQLEIHKAYSGREALRQLHRTRIDIVMTDIRMPGIDGLELMARIRETWPHCRIIFLTGYDEFDYVYQANRYPGVRYLLKAEAHEKVMAAIREAVADIERDIRIENLIGTATKRMNQARGLFQREYLLRLLAGDEMAMADAEQFEQFGVPFQADRPVHLVVGTLHNLVRERTYRERIQKLYSLRTLAELHLQDRARVIPLLDDMNRFVLFLQMDADVREAKAYLRGKLELVQEACRASLHFSISFASTITPCSWAQVPDMFDHLCHQLQCRLGPETEMILFAACRQGEEQRISSAAFAEMGLAEPIDAFRQVPRQVGVLTMYLETAQQEVFMTQMGTLLSLLRGVRSRNSPYALELYYSLAVMLLRQINRWELATRLPFHIGLMDLMRAENHASWDAAAAYLERVATLMFQLQDEGQSQHANSLIATVDGFIHAHLGEDLSLTRLAEVVYLNPSYLSRVYKGTTGHNLSEVIDKARFERARELLGGGSLRIHEAGRMVGYDTAASFTRFFRKWAGMTPQEYVESCAEARLPGEFSQKGDDTWA